MKSIFKSGMTAWAVCGAALLVGACGGGDVAADAPMTAAVATTNFADASDYGPGDRPGPLDASEPSALPVDHAARTRPGLYVRRAAAERMDRELRGNVVWVDAGCCAGHGVELAIYVAFGVQAAKNLDDGVPFLVTGADQRLAAQLVNRLADNGIRRAYLVTP